jgi:hypothetical protein
LGQDALGGRIEQEESAFGVGDDDALGEAVNDVPE